MPPRGGSSRTWLQAAFALDKRASSTWTGLPPVFLCPAARTVVAPSSPAPLSRRTWQRGYLQNTRCFSSVAASIAESTTVPSSSLGREGSEATTGAAPEAAKRLPLQCPGCGAFSQTTHPEQPGYFDLSRQSTREYLGLLERQHRFREEDQVVKDALRRFEQESGSPHAHLRGLLGDEVGQGRQENDGAPSDNSPSSILCVRCHSLVHHSAGTSISHPDIDAIRETIAESPYKYNHVYHVLDAADFPMSLLPRIHDLLDTMPLRSRNRRSRQGKFYGGRLTELTFVVTRSDLFAPRKEQVDKLMPWIRETLRDALGRTGRDVRLGSVHCVSARRNWWTNELKEEIWKRGGANWLVGKANVGKSYLVHHVFPKGRMANTKEEQRPPLTLQKSESGTYGIDPDQAQATEVNDLDAMLDADLDETALLPPRPRETDYPQMPVVSTLPGTTASPIRIPFGSGKGELIDLPGLSRTGLLDYIDKAHWDALVMKSRVRPEQVVLKGPWQSLLLGGFIRITPRTPNLVFLTYNFTPLREHRTMTEKAVAIQQQTSELRVENIATAGTGDETKLVGSFKLKYDVTKLRAGPITRKDAANIRVELLPYRVVALDLLIEGCGWVEIVAQVRTRELFKEGKPKREKTARMQAAGKSEILQTLDLSDPAEEEGAPPRERSRRNSGRKGREKDMGHEFEEGDEGDINWPVIDVYSPGGKFVGSRRPLNAWLLAQPKASIKQRRLRARPKRSMKGAKKQEKAERRAFSNES